MEPTQFMKNKLAKARDLLTTRALTDKQIANVTGLSYNCVREHRSQMGLAPTGKVGAPRLYSADFVQRIVRLRDQKGMTFKQIATKNGITERTAHRLYHTRGKETR